VYFILLSFFPSSISLSCPVYFTFRFFVLCDLHYCSRALSTPTCTSDRHPYSLPWRWGGSSTQTWMPTYVSILRIPQMILVWRATVEWYWQEKTEELGEKPVPVPLCPPQISHRLTRARTRASTVRGRRLTTWAMVRPTGICIPWINLFGLIYFIYFIFSLFHLISVTLPIRHSTHRTVLSWSEYCRPSLTCPHPSPPLTDYYCQASALSGLLLCLTPHFRARLTHHPDDGVSERPWQVSQFLPHYTTQHPRWQSLHTRREKLESHERK
jgi:hypothetical protein